MTIEVGKSGGGTFVPTFFSSALELSAGQTGTFLTLTPPAGERVRLIALLPPLTNQIASLSLQIAGNTIVTGSMTAVGTGWAVNALGKNGSGVDYSQGAGNLDGVCGGVDEVITVVNGGAATASSIFYSYQFGVFK
jgi:hypothetical protein